MLGDSTTCCFPGGLELQEQIASKFIQVSLIGPHSLGAAISVKEETVLYLRVCFLVPVSVKGRVDGKLRIVLLVDNTLSHWSWLGGWDPTPGFQKVMVICTCTRIQHHVTFLYLETKRELS